VTEAVQQLINGLSLGSIYALIALGYTMVYGVLRFINFAHGDVFMIGAFSGLYLARWLKPLVVGWPPLLAAFVVLAGSMCFCAALGMLIEVLAYRPLRKRPRLTVLITAIGVSLFLEYAGQLVFGAAPRGFPTLVPEKTYGMDIGLAVTSTQLIVVAVTLVLLALLRHVVLRTKLGMAMRAVSHNPSAAALMGIHTNVIISFTFGLGSALAAAAGIFYSLLYQAIDPFMGIGPGIKAFVAAVLGGIGSLPGAVLGGFLLGVLETFVGGSRFSTFRDGIAFAVLIAILLFKPSGLLGRGEREKV